METFFGTALRAERERRGLSPSEMSRLLDISHTQLKALESGARPRIDTADRIARTLGMRIVLGDAKSRRTLLA